MDTGDIYFGYISLLLIDKSCHSFKWYFCQLILKWNLHIGHYTYKDVQNFRNTLLDVKAEAWDMKSTQMTLANFWLSCVGSGIIAPKHL